MDLIFGDCDDIFANTNRYQEWKYCPVGNSAYIISKDCGNGCFEVSTNFINRHNVSISFYMQLYGDEEGRIVLFDEGATLSGLKADSIDIESSRYKKAIKAILERYYCVSRSEDNGLYMDIAEEDNLNYAVQIFSQVILLLDHLPIVLDVV